MWILILGFMTVPFFANETPEKPPRLWAEFEPTEYLWVKWQEGSSKKSPPLEDTTIEVIQVVSSVAQIRLFLDSNEDEDAIRHRLELLDVDMSKIHIHKTPFEAAITDPSPVFLETSHGWATVDFSWANYGIRRPGHPKTRITDEFDVAMAAQLGLPVKARSEFVWEGGAFDHNGRGLMVMAEQYFEQRHPDWTKERAETELHKQLGIQRIIWLGQGLAEDDLKVKLPGDLYPFGCGAHTDEFCRFADERTVLIAWVEDDDRDRHPLHAENHRRMQHNLDMLVQAKNLDGNPLNIIKVPTADHIVIDLPYDEIEDYDRPWFPGAGPGDTVRFVLPTSYLNFLVVNDLVVTARYWKQGRSESTRRKDLAAKEALERAFPGRRVMQINVEAYNHTGGGLHCYTYNEPLRNHHSVPVP